VKLEKIGVDALIPYIDWKFFFPAWNLSAKFHTITRIDRNDTAAYEKWKASYRDEEQEKAEEAAKLYRDAEDMLQRFADEHVDYVKAVFGIYEAYSENDTIVIGETPFPFLRQQKKTDSNEYFCLSDFISSRESGKKDYIGAFAVTAGDGADVEMRRFEEVGDDYSSLLMKSLLDRLAETATEWVHERVRRDYWGYAADERLSVAELFAVKYQGIRPAVGYPSIPDQTTNFLLHKLLATEEIGISLTENGVMYPNASVSGLFFAHPESKYFSIGEIDEAQMIDYARRKNMKPEEIRKFLLANLG